MATRPTRQHPEGGSGHTVRAPMSDSEFEVFYRQVFLPLVRRGIWKHRLTNEDARDIVQDAFVLAISKLDGQGNPRAWLIQVVDHLALNYRRKRQRRLDLTQRWLGGQPTPDRKLTTNEEADEST